MAQAVERLPHPALRPFIQRFLVVEFPAFHRDVHLPDTSPVAAFSFRGRCRIDGDQWAPLAAFTGLRETLRAHEHCHEHAVLLATFTPVGAAAFLRPRWKNLPGQPPISPASSIAQGNSIGFTNNSPELKTTPDA